MSQLRKIARATKQPVYQPEIPNHVRAWANRSFQKKYGDRAAEMAMVCRVKGLRDLVIPVGNIAECIPNVRRLAVVKPVCQHGGMYDSAGSQTERCRAPAALLSITDSGLELFFCEAHAEERVVRMP